MISPENFPLYINMWFGLMIGFVAMLCGIVLFVANKKFLSLITIGIGMVVLYVAYSIYTVIGLW